MKILAIDDDARLLAEVENILVRHGHDVHAVTSATEGIAHLKDNVYDFVLVDYRMPEHDGMWFMRHAAVPRGTKVLLVSSLIESNLVREMSKEGISGYVMKPFDEEELVHHLALHSKLNPPR